MAKVTSDPKHHPATILRRQDGTYRKGVSGNPTGRKEGTRTRAALAAQALLDGEVESLSRKTIEMALAGDTVALKLCLERVLPVRRRNATPIDVAPLDTIQDVLRAAGLIATETAAGELDLDAATVLANLVEGKRRAIETIELEKRIAEIEERQKEGGG
jgi:hypothetical protein